MPTGKRSWTWLLMFSLLAVCWGCGGKTSEQRTAEGPEGGGGLVKTSKTGKTQPPRKPKPEPPPTIPKVELTKEYEQKCRVFQGQQMPEAELTDLESNAKPLKSLYGSKLTVVCFWSLGATPKGPPTIGLKQMLAELAAIGGKFPPPSVRFAGVDVNDPPEEAAKLLKEANVTFSNLFDPQGTFFEKIGTDALPRIYLLDAQGKILWFDLLKLTSFDSNLRQLEFCIEIALKQ